MSGPALGHDLRRDQPHHRQDAERHDELAHQMLGVRIMGAGLGHRYRVANAIL